ncbi:MAG: transposase [FCB group bacterium]|jgi:REP element-mobilizing transposase RayT
MRTRYKIFDTKTVYFITSSIVDWCEIFISQKYFDILINALSYKRTESNLKLYAYVFMKNHIHLIISCENIIKFVKEYKSYTAHEIIKQLKLENEIDTLEKFKLSKKSYKEDSNYQVWQEGFHPELIYSMEIFRQKAEYIHNNPVLKGYVLKAEDWKYSSASNYILGEGIIEIDSPL